MHTNPEIEAIAQAIKNAVPAERIYLFGSYTYGTPHKDSDYDFFVVIPDETMRPIEAMQRAQGAIRDRNRAIDVLANTRSGFEKRKTWVASIEKTVNQKGVLLYDGRSRRVA